MNKYEEIARRLKDRIQSGTYPPGQKLPSEAELCREFSASRLSVRSALGQGLVCLSGRAVGRDSAFLSGRFHQPDGFF